MNPLQNLLDLAEQKAQLDAAMHAAVAAARAEGHSWQAIANKIGGTKQAAQQRYSKPRNTSRDHLYTAAENAEADAALAAMQRVAAKQDAAAQLEGQTAIFLDGTAPATHEDNIRALNRAELARYGTDAENARAQREEDEINATLAAAAVKFKAWDHTAAEHHSAPMEGRPKACPYCLHLSHLDGKGMTWFYPGCEATTKDPAPAQLEQRVF